MRVARLSFAIVLFISVRSGAIAQQFADPEFDARVDRPAFTDHHPVVFVDAAHNNFHTADDRYKPLAELLKNDGYTVTPNKKKFTTETLKNCAILVASNAQGAPLMRSPEAANPAFEPAECDAVHDWVQAGGSILLIADHHPWGAANAILGTRLGVDMGKSTTLDPTNAEQGFPGQLNFSRLNGLLGKHPILMGRDGSERIDRVVTFTGQSLKGRDGSVLLLKLASSAFDQSRPTIPGRNAPAAGRAQGLAISLGQGKIVVLGEAAMLSAQVNGRQRVRMGMNVPGTDNKQFALNIMHWLSGMKLGAHEELIAAKPAADIAQSRPTDPGRLLSSAEIAAESEPSIAMITGDGSVGTGFLVRPGVIATNAHVIEDEFMTTVRVRFPSAEKSQQGPVLAELLYEDTRRDLAFLRVKSSLPPLRIAAAYKFRKGEDVTAIGNPGAGDQLILENAISRGLMSTRTALEGQRYYQLTIAVNPGNSGGPVFDSKGAVIGVVTRKSSQQESLAFCIPVEELKLALAKVDSFPPDAIARQQSRHRLILAVKELGGLGAFYSVGITGRRGKGVKITNDVFESFFIAGFDRLNNRAYPRLKAEVVQVQQDSLISQELREKVGQLGANLDKLRTLFSANNPGDEKNEGFSTMQATHLRLLAEICKVVQLDLPVGMQAAFGQPTDKSSEKGASKE